MHLHLVGGFLGSGKTTAIIAAAKHLMHQGQVVGVVTNDQGKYLVDTAFVRLNAIPAVEVTGGCFCCNYTDLTDRLEQLRSQVKPDVVFAESVGSCGDLVATVVKPLQELDGGPFPPTSFSAFADARLLLARLRGEELPFSDNVIYLFDQQIEETTLLVVNKIDLLEPGEVEEIELLARRRYPEKTVRLQNSTDPAQVKDWFELIDDYPSGLPSRAIDMDYTRYGDGEAQLAWLDQEIQICAPRENLSQVLTSLISSILAGIRRQGAGIGHLKFLVAWDGQERKISIPTLEQTGWQAALAAVYGNEAMILVNARVEMDVEQLQTLILESVKDNSATFGAEFSAGQADAFHPKFPNPTHRLGL